MRESVVDNNSAGSGSDVWQLPPMEQGLGRFAVVVLDVPPDAAAAGVRAIGCDVVMAVQGSQTSALKSMRQALISGRIDRILAYSSDWTRQNYPNLYEVALSAITGGRTWLLADGASMKVSRRGGIRTAASISEFAAGSVHAARQVVAARREVRAFDGALSPPSIRVATAANQTSSAWILVVWRGSPNAVGGAITHLLGVLQGFRTLGYRIALVSAYPLPLGVDKHVERFVLTGPLASSRRFTPDTARLAIDRQIYEVCRQLVAQLRPFCIYQRHAYQSVAGAMVAVHTGVPFVLEWNFSELWTKRHMWGSYPLEFMSGHFERLAEVREVQVVKSAAVVAAVSRVAAKMAMDCGGNRARVLTVPNGVDFADVPLTPPLPDRAPGALLGWVGTFGPWHGAEVAVRALVHLPSPIRLLMIGDGVSRMGCQELATELGVEARVEFSGSLPRAKAIARLQDCDVLLSPHVAVADTPFFGSPTKLFEYMAIGRPIVASDLEQIADILVDGHTARLVTPGDEAALAGGILDVLSLSDRGAGLGRAARQDAAEHHTLETRLQQMLEALRP